MSSSPTAAILVIGDEILKGHTRDTNSGFAARILYRLGVKVSRIVVVSDVKEEIVAEVRALSGQHSFLVTSGGVGPTHDDVTYEAVAAAFEMPLVQSEDLVEFVKNFYALERPDSDKTAPALKMALVPKEHTLLFAEDRKKPGKVRKWSPGSFPAVKVKNVFVLPGLPVCFEACFRGLQHCFPSALGSWFMEFMHLTIEESEIADILEDTIKECGVVIGCYPIVGNPSFQTKLTLEANRPDRLREAVDLIKSKLSPETVVDLFPMELALEKLDNLNSHGMTKAAFQVFEECHKKYPDGEIVISFNGGKDCTLLLHLYNLFLRSEGLADKKVKALYIRNQEPFHEVEEFLAKAVKRYNLEMVEYNEQIKAGVEKLLENHPKVSAILMGNRSTDPYSSELSTFQMTDKGWPQVMRVFPILEWSYAQVWQALLVLGVEYCSLYNQGYSSLGNPKNTCPNPALRYEDEKGLVHYRPAYHLVDGSEERAGRNKPTP